MAQTNTHGKSRRWMRRGMGIALGLVIGWALGGYVANAQASEGHGSTVAAAAPAEGEHTGQSTHEAAGNHEAVGGSEGEGEHEGGQVHDAAGQLTPVEAMPWLRYVLWGMGGLFVAATVTGPFVVLYRKAYPEVAEPRPHVDAHH